MKYETLVNNQLISPLNKQLYNEINKNPFQITHMFSSYDKGQYMKLYTVSEKKKPQTHEKDFL